METDCILCGGCADICPENCIEIIYIENYRPYVKKQLPQNINGNNNQSVILVKDDFFCTRCGLCAKRCPVGAITFFPIEEKEILLFND